MPIFSTRVVLVAALIVGGPVVAGAPARAEKQDARKHYDSATAAFGLGRYAEAAAEYEAAFRMRPDPALLYNCAQSYRLAGNKPRALELYKNYVRLYGESSNADDARKHVSDLEAEVAAEKATAPRPIVVVPSSVPAASAPPPLLVSPAPVVPRSAPAPTSAIADVPPPVAPLPPAAVADVHVDVPATENAPPGESDAAGKPLVQRPWFWVAIGAVVVGGAVAIVLAASGDKDPKATLGSLAGN